MDKLFDKHIKIVLGLETKYVNSLYEKLPWNEKLLGIIGARGVGKTTLLLQYIKENYNFDNKVLYFSFDSVSFSYNSLYELAEDFVKQGGEHLFIDEIHKYPNWSQELKDIYDSIPGLKVVFTGSSILDIYKGKADLSRRALIFNMQGLSFREFLQIETGQNFEKYSLNEILKNHQKIAIEIYQKVKPYEFFNEYFKTGYYPFYLQNKEFYSMRLSSTINQIIEVDMPQLLGVDYHYIAKLKRLVNLLANEIPFKPNITDLSAAIGVSWQTLINYLNYLHKAKIITVVYPHNKAVSSLSKPEKLYLHHPNLFYVFKDNISNRGSIRETFFVNQISYNHKVDIAKKGDFIVDNKYIFEIGGKNKTYHQIANTQNSFIVADDIEFGIGNKIPLWIFGFLY